MSLKKTIDFIRRHDNFLITSHTNMEGDALGSELAFYRLVRSLKKRATLINDDAIPYGYDFLPMVSRIRKFKRGMKGVTFDAFVALDCSDLKRAGEVHTLNDAGKPVLNIDHHISNARFGQVNWVEPRASSCTEIVFDLYKAMRVPIDRDTAMLLYVGIATDTGYFRYPNTTAKAHAVTAELLKHHLDTAAIYKNLNENIPFEDMMLLAKILPTMQRRMQGKVVWYELRKKSLAVREKLSFDLSEHILTFARAIRGVEVAVLFKENFTRRNEVRVNLRSKGCVDVNKIASFFGGGGHRTASGCTIKGSLVQVKKQVLKRIDGAF